MAVIVLTNRMDPTSDVVIDVLHRRGIEVVRADLDDLIVTAELVAGRWIGELGTQDRRVPIDTVTGLYYRRPTPPTVPSGRHGDVARWVAEERRWGLRGLLVALPRAVWLSWPPAIRAAEHKPHALAAAARAGLTIPATIITNQPGPAAEFARTAGPVLYKAFRGGPVHHDDGRTVLTYATPVTAEQIDDSVRHAPITLQQRIVKVRDVRVTYVDGHTFAVSPTRNGAVPLDWRDDHDANTWSPVQVPDDVRAGLRCLCAGLGLRFCAADFSDALVTQLDGDDHLTEAARRGEPVSGTPTSSSSAPPLMAAMLHALDVTDGHRVLEAATGTGYNAALLAHRLGDDHVTSIEVDPGIAARATTALTRIRRAPHVDVGDAAAGSPNRAPFDRVISTVAVPHVPPAWLTQTRPDAVLVVPLVAAGHGGIMARLRRDRHGGAHGHLMTDYGGFMATRATTLPPPPRIRPSLLTHTRPTRIPAAALGGSHPATYFLALLAPPFRTLGFTPDDTGVPQTWGRGPDDSTFAITEIDGEQRVATEGPLWDHLETAYQRWLDLDRPERHRIGLTVTTAGTHTFWIDHPSIALRPSAV